MAFIVTGSSAIGGLVLGGLAGSQLLGGGGSQNQGSNVDYAAAAQAQGQANLDAARLTTQLNRPNQITPWGSQMWYQGPYPGTQASGPAPSAGTGGGRVGTGNPINLGGGRAAPGGSGILGGGNISVTGGGMATGPYNRRHGRAGRTL